ncbi:MAG: hypothetical protein IMZ43_09440, partial [Thermoplasmata archaeon]|nr:hypothetical protein [Thermoplasmata archaeon]
YHPLISKHDSYTFYTIKNDKIRLPDTKGGYLILEKTTDQDYSIAKGDTILYRTTKDTLRYRVVDQINIQQGALTYYTAAINEDDLDGPIYDQQIIGKIKGRIDDNIWNAFSLQIWELCIHNLNAAALFTNV